MYVDEIRVRLAENRPQKQVGKTPGGHLLFLNIIITIYP